MNEAHLRRIVAAAVFAGMMAGNWDAWWHKTLGRTSNWEPPHLVLYVTAVIAVGCAAYGWRKYRSQGWRRLAGVLLLMLASAPLDTAWHAKFGVETVATPLIVWSPPHMFYIVSMILASWFLLRLLDGERDAQARHFFSCMIFACVLNPLFFIAGPLIPAGPFHLLGSWGAAVPAFLFVAVSLLAERRIGGIGTVTTMTMFFLMLGLTITGSEISSISGYPAHGFPPVWLVIFTLFLPAVFLDATKGRLPDWVRGSLASLLFVGLLYALSSNYFPPQFRYPATEALVAAVSGVFGGAVAALAVRRQRGTTDVVAG